MFRKRRRRRASSDGEGEGGSQRVQLACFWCRSKRVRCSGTKPVCEVSRSVRSCASPKDENDSPHGEASPWDRSRTGNLTQEGGGNRNKELTVGV
jgi:hypothetical protein